MVMEDEIVYHFYLPITIKRSENNSLRFITLQFETVLS